jgi:starch-binding outer membrane protein, SusD/RagB family
MKSYLVLSFSLLFGLGIISSCKKSFLDVKPKGTLNEFVLANDEGIDAILTGAYSMLDGVAEGVGGWESASSNWVFGSIRGLEANFGSGSGTQGDLLQIQNFSETPTHSYLEIKWKEIYEAVSRCNNVIMVIDQGLKQGSIDTTKADLFLKQAKALRGWYHFEAWRMWEKIPYVDEDTNAATVTNRFDIRSKIISDLEEGIDLPDNMGQVGRFNGTVSKVLLAKALMQMNHDYTDALTQLLDAKNGSKPDGSPIGLAPTYGEIFDLVNRNGIEAVYTVQTSVNDGSGGYNGGYGEVMNFPMKSGASPGGCCGFFQPTQEFVNSFDVDANGLPFLDNSFDSGANQNFRDQGVPGGSEWDSLKTYDKYPYWIDSAYFYGNLGCTIYDPAHPYRDLGYVSIITKNKGNNPVTNPAAWRLKWTEDNSKPVDPRLDWTVGRRGIPYWDWGVHTGSDWIREQSYAGPYSPKKMVYKKSEEGKYTEVDSWTSGFTANGYRMVRYADILLLIAECQIETGDLPGALVNINLVRNRAANPDGFVMEDDGITPAATYEVKPYPSFPDQNYARNALRMERKLELGMEGHRWFDLNRWGITVDELNRALAYEKSMPWGKNMYQDAVAGPEDVTYPIPQHQIDLSNGRLIQNR